ncbi:MAG: biopolymer transporter ExbD [Chthoniobacterales bacterium]|nr:biopolymer transporter ExbD [Chthoniobacterales bacterium]
MPTSRFYFSNVQNPLIVGITGLPTPGILYSNRRMTFEQFTEAFRSKSKPGTLILKADQTAPHGLVIAVSNLGLEAGCQVVIATDEPRSNDITPLR